MHAKRRRLRLPDLRTASSERASVANTAEGFDRTKTSKVGSSPVTTARISRLPKVTAASSVGLHHRLGGTAVGGFHRCGAVDSGLFRHPINRSLAVRADPGMTLNHSLIRITIRPPAFTRSGLNSTPENVKYWAEPFTQGGRWPTASFSYLAQARISGGIRPPTSVSLKSRPAWRYVRRV